MQKNLYRKTALSTYVGAFPLSSGPSMDPFPSGEHQLCRYRLILFHKELGQVLEKLMLVRRQRTALKQVG